MHLLPDALLLRARRVTCIVGVVHGKDVYVGGDSAGTAGYQVRVRTDTKVFSLNPRPTERWLLGYCGSFRVGQALRFGFTVPERPKGMDLYEFMCTKFVDAVRSRLRDAGTRRKKDDEESVYASILAAHAGKLYCIESDFQVAEFQDGYTAIGSGEELALGALWATENRRPEYRIRKALEAAAYWNAAVCEPFTVKKL
jgi:ATP-dependent protease HslVU (ClpYQ) peptidase subunit